MVEPRFISKRCSLPRQPPLPILQFDETGNVIHISPRPVYHGTFTGFNVIVRTQDVMLNLYTKGYFGKGNLSSGYPSYQKKLLKAHEEKKTADDEDGVTADEVLIVKPDNADVEKSNGANDIGEGVRHPSSKQAHSENESVNEELHLFLEEAFFLSYALDCLRIINNDEALDHRDAWFTFQKVQSKFIERYVAYHHFRTKGWVVRSGVKYGGDYVLYKDGPPFYHATYVVCIVSNDIRDINFFLACYRAVEVTKKELLICRVKVPNCSGEVFDLDSLKECQVSEYILKRWTPTENR